MRSITGFTAAAAALLAMLAPAAQAQVNEQTAEELRRALKAAIGQQVQQAGSAYTVELDGGIVVVPDGNLFRVTLPAGRATIDHEGTLHFDETVLNMTPLENGWYDANWTLPDSYRLQPAYGSDVLITVGRQSGQGVFAPAYHTMMSMDSMLGDILVADGEVRLAIDQITTVTQSNEVSPEIYDLQSTMRAEGIRFATNDNRNSFTLSDIEIVVVTDDGRLADLARFQQQADILAADLENSNLDQIDAEFASLAEFMDTVPTLVAGVRMDIGLGAISVEDYGDRFTMDRAALSVTLDGLDQDRSEVALSMQSDGMSVSDSDVAALLPTETRFRLAMTELPNGELLDIGIGALRSMGTTDPAMAMLMASGGLQQALTTADSTLVIGPIRLASDIASIDMEGILRADASSPYGTVGEVDMVATGLDTLIGQLQKTSGDPDAIQFLTFLQTLGAQAPDADGRTVRTYAFRLDNTGTLLLNGSDIMPLIGAL